VSEFVKVTGSPADVIGAATLITGAGEALKAQMPGLLSEIERLETDDVIGRDEFAAGFTKTYRQPAAAGSGSAATKQAATTVSGAGGQIGGAVISAMQDYMVTDGQGAADIGNTIEA
jgi:hypothetical protein